MFVEVKGNVKVNMHVQCMEDETKVDRRERGPGQHQWWAAVVQRNQLQGLLE